MKRATIAIVLSMALLIGMLSGILIMPAAAQEAVTRTAGNGDYNVDGTIDIYDYMAIARYINGNLLLSAAQKQRLDVFADGAVDMYDAVCIFRYINQQDDTLGGSAQSRPGTYAQLSLEEAVYAGMPAVGDIVEVDLTVSAVKDLLALEMRMMYDESIFAFVQAVSPVGMSVAANDTPVSAANELWLSMVSDEPVEAKNDTVVATLRFEVIAPIGARSAVTILSAKAVSLEAINGLYSQAVTVKDGAVVVEAAVTTTTVASQDYITYTIETVSHEGTIAEGETVELDICVNAASDFNGMQLNLCYDDEEWEWVEGRFVGALASFDFKTVNTNPFNPMTDKGEVWLTAMAMKGHTLADGEVIATVMLKARKAIKSDSVIGACYSKASSYDGTMKGYEPTSSWVDGGVHVVKRTYTGPLGDYFYQNSERVNAYRLIAHNGDFYFVGDYNKLAKSTTVYLADSFVAGHVYEDGTPLTAGKYDFDADGKMVIKNGPVGDFFYKNNTKLQAYQLVAFEGDYYYIGDAHKLAKATTLYLSEKFVAGHTNPDGSAMQEGKYDFDADGKMIIKNGPVGDFFYKNNTRLNAYQLVAFEGNYYYISDAHKLAKSTTLHLSEKFVAGHTNPDGSAMQEGKYEFDADGKMIIKNGPVGDFFYKNNTRLNAYQLVVFEGDYYYIGDAHKLAKATTLYLSEKFVAGHTNPDGSAMQEGKYEFDADGKMLIKNGPVGDFFYKNNTRLNAYQLVEFEGNYYYIGDSHKLAKGTTLYLSDNHVAGHVNPDGSAMQAGKYEFDADGKMLIKNGPVGDFFYKNNTRLNAYQLVEFEGNYYYIGDAHKLAKATTLYLNDTHVAGHVNPDGSPMNAGKYDFDESGKMIIKNGVVGDFFYKNNIKLEAYQLVEFEGHYYYIADSHKVVKNATVYLTESVVEDVFTAEGHPIFPGRYTFDADGKMIL